MIMVIFEVCFHHGAQEDYMTIAGRLKQSLETIPSFISSERFSSLNNPYKILSMSYWENEEAVEQWRNSIEHRQAQQQGYDNLFTDYKICVVQIIREHTLTERDGAPVDSKLYHQC